MSNNLTLDNLLGNTRSADPISDFVEIKRMMNAGYPGVKTQYTDGMSVRQALEKTGEQAISVMIQRAGSVIEVSLSDPLHKFDVILISSQAIEGAANSNEERMDKSQFFKGVLPYAQISTEEGQVSPDVFQEELANLVSLNIAQLREKLVSGEIPTNFPQSLAAKEDTLRELILQADQNKIATVNSTLRHAVQQEPSRLGAHLRLAVASVHRQDWNVVDKTQEIEDFKQEFYDDYTVEQVLSGIELITSLKEINDSMFPDSPLNFDEAQNVIDQAAELGITLERK